MPILVFEDPLVEQLAPVTLGRPAMAVHCASLRLVDLVSRLPGEIRYVVRQYLEEIVAADYPSQGSSDKDSGPVAEAPKTEAPLLCLNSRLVPSFAALDRIAALYQSGEPCVVRKGDCVAAAILPDGQSLPDPLTVDSLHGFWRQGNPREVQVELPLFEWPHEIIRHHLALLKDNLAQRIVRGDYREIEEGVFASGEVELGPYTVSDTERGPIVLEDGIRIGAGTYLSGPLHLDQNTQVAPHTLLRPGVAAGQKTKLAGEIEASIIESYSNKCHDGYLGHSYLGSWVNLGAGTSVSNLKNTYGEITITYGQRRVPTGMQFVGCFFGDYARTAIHTSIFTGKTVGPGSMLYGTVTGNVPSFVNYAPQIGQMTEVDVEVIIATQQRMFARRGVEQRPCDVELLRAMFEWTRSERIIDGKPLAAVPLRF